MTPPAPERQHRWLKQLLGDWAFEAECVAGPDQPPHKSSGKDSVRALGDLWVVCEGAGEAPGGEIGHSIITLGYDPAKGKFVGTFVGSMMPSLWIYEGSLDAAERVLTLDTVGPSFDSPGKLVDYQDIFEVVDADHRILRSQVKGADGNWTQFMTSHYTRVK